MQILRVDLHSHTHFSDGTLSPEDLVKNAKELGLAALAITDHDTTKGIPQGLQAGQELGVEVIPGVEISALYDKGTLHILGYFINHNDEILQSKLQEFIDARNKRNPQILEKLAALGFELDIDEVRTFAEGNVINRPHIARAMLNRGYVDNIQEAFDRFLAQGGPAYMPKEVFTPEESIAIIHQAGGLAVLAHPDQLKAGSIDATINEIRRFAQMSIDGVEAYHGTCKPEHSEPYAAIANELGLFVTGGSDFHGDTKHNNLGEVSGLPHLPYELVEKMKAHLHLKNETLIS